MNRKTVSTLPLLALDRGEAVRIRTSMAIGLWLAVLVAATMACGFAVAFSDRAAEFRDRWSAADIAVLASLRSSQLAPAPPDPSHAVERSPAAAKLGKRRFDDTRFSRNQAVSCATCVEIRKP